MFEKIRLKVQGMNCIHCATAVKSVLSETKGVSTVKVNYKNNQADLEYDSSQVNINELINEIRKIGFDASRVS